jgi:tetratricopeptide (TPR) repeat protein
MQYKGVKKPLHDIASELGVEGVIEGSVLREGQKVRVSVQLFEAINEHSVWAERYDRDMTSILALQGEVAGEVAARARAELTPQEKVELARSQTVKPEAYEAYLRGRAYLESNTDADHARSVEELQRAVVIDPSFAMGYAWLVEALLQHRPLEFEPGSLQRARQLALKSIQLDDSLAEAHLAVARTADKWEISEREYKRALELKPGYAPALSAYASYYLSYVGRLDEAIALLKRTVELEPRSRMERGKLGRRLFLARRYSEAIEQFQIILKQDPDDSYTRANLGRAYLFEGHLDAGMSELEKAGNDEYLALGYAMVGKRTQALRIVQRNKKIWARTAPTDIAVVYAALGEKDEAFRWLDQAFSMKDDYLSTFKVHPIFDPLRSDPRFQVMLRRMNFPE